MALDPYRIVPGENVTQRALRIEAETGNMAGTNPNLPPIDLGHALMPTLNAGANWLAAPQGPQGGDQTDAGYIAGSAIKGLAQLPWNTIQALGQHVGQPLVNLFTQTPNSRAAAAQQTVQPQNGPAFDPNNPFADVMPSSTAPSMQPTYLDKVALAFKNAGATPTSAMRSPAHNAGVGGVGDSMHLTGEAVDIPKVGGMTLEKAKALAASQGVTVTEALDEGSHFHIGWRPGGAGPVPNDPYALASNFGNPFTMGGASSPQAYGQQALGALNAGEQAALQPQTVSVPGAGPGPQVPTPQDAAPTDFSKSDAALADMQPAEMLDAEKRKIIRSDILTGIGRSLQSLPDGAGLGKVLATIGGGALAGKGVGESEVRDRMDKFDADMARYKMAVYQGDLGKAQVAHAEATHHIDAINQQAYQQWEANWQRFNKDNFVSASPEGVTVSRTGADGKVQIQTIPNASAIRAGFAARKAGVFGEMASGAEQGNAAQLQPANSLMMYQAMKQYTSGPNGPDGIQALTQSPAFLAGSVVEGNLSANLFGGTDSDGWKAAQKEVAKRLGNAYVPGSKEYTEAFKNGMAALITENAYNPALKDFRRQLLNVGTLGTTLSAANALHDAKSRTSTDWRGRTSSQETVSGQ